MKWELIIPSMRGLINTWDDNDFVLLSVKYHDPEMYQLLGKYYNFTRFQCDHTSENGDFRRLIICTVKMRRKTMRTVFRTVSTAIKRCKHFSEDPDERRYYTTFLPTKEKLLERITEVQTSYIRKGNVDFSNTCQYTPCCVFADKAEQHSFMRYFRFN